MGSTLARAIVFFVSTLLLLYSITVAATSFGGINITAFHLSEPLLIGYGVFWLVVAPSGLWGIFGSTQNNVDLCNRYLRDHWFSSALITIIDIIKVVFTFTMKNNSVQKCLDGSKAPLNNCRKKVDFFQELALIIFGVQEILLIFLGILVWVSCKYLMKKKDEKKKIELGDDLEILEKKDICQTNNDDNRNSTNHNHNSTNDNYDLVSDNYDSTNDDFSTNDDDSVNNYEFKNQSQERITTNSPSFIRHSSQYNYNNKGGQNEQQRINENILRSQGDNANINNVNNAINNINNINNVKNVQQQYATPKYPRRSYDRPMTPSDELQNQGMNQINRSKSMAPPVRPNSNRPPPQRFMPPVQYLQGMRNSLAPFPPPYYYNGPPLPQFQQIPNFQPMYPWQQQWIGYNNGPKLPQEEFRGHRRSRSQPELRPLSFHPSSIDYMNPPQIPNQAIPPPPQVIERQQIDLKNSKNKNENNDDNNSISSSRRSSASSRYRTPVIEQKRLYSQAQRANSLPNLTNHEDLMRNEMSSAPPVPSIPSSLQSGTKNSDDNNNKSDRRNMRVSQPPLSNADKFEKFIQMYGNKEYDMSSHYNKYSELQNNDYNIAPKRPRPKSAQAVKGEASPKPPSIYIDDDRYYYNNYYYYGQPSGYNQEVMNNRNNNYVYPQYVRPMGYNNNRGSYQNNPTGYNDGWVNYGQQRPPQDYYY